MFELNSTKIRSLLLEKQMTIRAFAKAAGFTEATAQKVVRTNPRVNARTAGRVASAFAVEPQKILRSDSND